MLFIYVMCFGQNEVLRLPCYVREMYEKITGMVDPLFFCLCFDKFIYCKYSHKDITEDDKWNVNIKQTIDMRNNLVHPKQMINLTYVQTEKALDSILITVNVLFNAVYKKNVPIFNYGLQAISIE